MGRKVCHVKVAEVAKAAAGRLYEALMGDNEYYEIWKKQNPGASPKELEKRFINRNWQNCIEFARATMTLMLTRDDVDESLKEEIMIILEQDQSIKNMNVSGPPFGTGRKTH
jgi:hypothetical protein